MNLDQLLTAAQKGDKDAEDNLFGILSVRFRLIAYRIIRDNQAAEDVAQEAVLDVLKAFRDLAVRESFTAWLRVVVRNRAFKYLESRKRQTGLAEELSEIDASAPGEQLSGELQRRLLDCLEKLSKLDIRYGRIINLKHQGYAVDEICKKLGLNANHVYVILHRARRSLKACLDEGWNS